jgi:hypothetical protein
VGKRPERDRPEHADRKEERDKGAGDVAAGGLEVRLVE